MKTVGRIHLKGMNAILNFIPRLAPGAINATNYKWTYYKDSELREWNEKYRQLPRKEREPALQQLLRDNGGWCAVTITENGASRVILVHHDNYGNNVDQVELNPELRKCRISWSAYWNGRSDWAPMK